MGETAITVDLLRAHHLRCNAVCVNHPQATLARCNKRCRDANMLKVFSALSCQQVFFQSAAELCHWLHGQAIDDFLLLEDIKRCFTVAKIADFCLLLFSEDDHFFSMCNRLFLFVYNFIFCSGNFTFTSYLPMAFAQSFFIVYFDYMNRGSLLFYWPTAQL